MNPEASSTSFWDEQTRHRRAARLWTVVLAVTALALGLPLAIAITPIVFFFGVVLLRILSLVLPIPPVVWEWIRELPSVAPSIADALFELSGAESPSLVSQVPWIALLLAPGFAVMAILWWLVRRLSLRDGAGTALLAARARPLRPDADDERRLANVVEEMAVAAGEPPPGVVLLDEAIPNAAIAGTSVDDATIVVTRGLLEQLDRDGTQAVVGHLVAQVAAGDLRLGLSSLAVVRAMGVVLTAGDALLLFSPSAWHELGEVARWTTSEGDEEAADRIARSFARRLRKEPEDGWPAWARESSWGTILILPLLPVYLLLLALRAEVLVLRFLLIEPVVAMVLRRRRYLADALAVQLTRNPAALERALARIGRKGGLPIVLAQVEHLFLVGRAAKPRHAGWKYRVHPAPEDRRERLESMTFESDGAPSLSRHSLRSLFSGPWQLRDLFVLPLFGLALLAIIGGVVWTVAWVFLFAVGIAVGVASASLWLIVKLLVP